MVDAADEYGANRFDVTSDKDSIPGVGLDLPVAGQWGGGGVLDDTCDIYQAARKPHVGVGLEPAAFLGDEEVAAE